MIPFTSVPTRVAAPLIALALAACGQGSTDPVAGVRPLRWSGSLG